MRYQNTNVELSAVTSISSPSISIDGQSYAFTVSLDHNLRIWNLSNGRIAYIGDILGQEIDPKNLRKSVIDPSYSQLVKVYGHNNESALCVTYSPIGEGQFKFWNVTPAADGNLNVSDSFPNNILVPPAPTSDLWTMADFSVIPNRARNSLSLWTLWKNNTTYRVQKIVLRGGSEEEFDICWKQGWGAMASESLAQMPLPTVYPGDASDSTDKWLAYILYPGKFTHATIETGLAIYERGLGTSRDISRRSAPLPERLCSSIATTATLGRASEGGADFEQFRLATDAQWRRFYRLLVELDKQRGEALSLTIDPVGDMPWVVSADGLSAVRDSSSLERIWHNPDYAEEIVPGTKYLSTLLTAGSLFGEAVPDVLYHGFRSALLGQLYEEPTLLPTARMKMLYDSCDYSNQIGDAEYHELVQNLGGTFKDVNLHVYETLLDFMTSFRDSRHPLPLANTGNRLIVKGVQETIELHKSICLDQLLLLVLIEVEINHGEEGIEFETSEVFNELLIMLRRLELVSWLAKTQIDLPLPNRERSDSTEESTASLSRKPISYETITVLEGVHRHLFGLERGLSMPTALTDFIGELCKPDSKYESSPAIIQCFLLKHNQSDLAMEFSRFTEHDSFSTYIQGRACLAANDPRTAALHFKKAAFGMGKLLQPLNFGRIMTNNCS